MNERRVREERRRISRPPEKIMAHLKDWYEKSAEKMRKGTRGPVEPIYKLKNGAEGETILFNDNGKRYEISKEFCSEMYEKLITAMFDGGDMEGLGALGEDDLLVAAANNHPEVEIAIDAATVIALRNPVKKEDLEFLIMSEHEEVRKMAEEHYFENDAEIVIDQ